MTNIFDLLNRKQDPIGGLYIHILQPNQTIIEPGKQIEKGMLVLKHGMFSGKLSDRMKSYFSAKYWHFENGDAAFKSSAISSYLIFDATELPKKHRWLLAGLEIKIGQLIEEHFDVIGKIGKGKSEYRHINPTCLANNMNLKILDISFEVYSLVQKVVGSDFYPLMNSSTFDEEIFYRTPFFNELHKDLKKNRGLLLRLLPNIWGWEDQNSLDEIKQIIRKNFGAELNFFKEALTNQDEDGSCLTLADTDVLANKEFLLFWVQTSTNRGLNPMTHVFAPKILLEDPIFLDQVLEINDQEFENIGPLVTNKKTVLSVLKINKKYIAYVNEKLKNDLDVINASA